MCVVVREVWNEDCVSTERKQIQCLYKEEVGVKVRERKWRKKRDQDGYVGRVTNVRKGGNKTRSDNNCIRALNSRVVFMGKLGF